MIFRRTQAVFKAVCARGNYFNVGAGIVADSNPDAEYEETLAKAAGFLAALKVAERQTEISPAQRAGSIVPK
jgi:anthranilate/para-aminobenzoate synthase component I